MLDTFNKSWREGVCPQSWRDAVIVPILKPGKPQGQLDSYRPIAFTSCLAKVMERMVAKRLQHLAESCGILTGGLYMPTLWGGEETLCRSPYRFWLCRRIRYRWRSSSGRSLSGITHDHLPPTHTHTHTQQQQQQKQERQNNNSSSSRLSDSDHQFPTPHLSKKVDMRERRWGIGTK
jgi:hypothetical protein